MWAHLGAMLAHLGAMLAHLRAMLAILGLCWPILRPMLAHLEAYVGPCWPILSHKLRKRRKHAKSTKPCKTQDILALPGGSPAGGAAPLSYGEERTAVRQGHGQGAPGRTKGLRPLPPTPVVLGLFCIMLDKFHKDRMPDVAFWTYKKTSCLSCLPACGPWPPVPNVAFWTYKKISCLSCLPAAKAHKRRLRHAERAGIWRTDRACGPRPPLPNVTFWTYKKTSYLPAAKAHKRRLHVTAPPF